jgi:hypothetical protein
MKTLTLLAATAAIALATAAQAGESATYSVTLEAAWTAQSHPLDYPQGAHFSGLIGATHDGAYSLFRADGSATLGLENLAEKGAHSPLDAEIKAAIASQAAGSLIEGRPIFGPPGQDMVAFTIDPAHPKVSLVAMIAPSPDWFTGVADVALFENGQWVAEKTVVLEAWDAGTDGGTTYRAADADMEPQGPIAPNTSAHFQPNGKVVPVGTVTFRRQ